MSEIRYIRVGHVPILATGDFGKCNICKRLFERGEHIYAPVGKPAVQVCSLCVS